MTTVEAEAPVVTREGARWNALRVLWDVSLPGHRVRQCRRHSVLEDGIVQLRVSGKGETRSAGFGGLATCGSTWACPCCSARIAAHRQDELRRAVDAWEARGGRVVLGTFTMRHKKGQRLKTLWGAISAAWSAVTTGRGWIDDKWQYGVEGFCRVVEVTHGTNGWHVHVHCVLFLKANEWLPGLDFDVPGLMLSMFGRWKSSLEASGFQAPTKRRGVDGKLVTPGAAVDLGDYFAKNTYTADDLALEVARADLKDARHGNRTPFGILRDVVRLGDADDLDLWHEWQAASKGKRQMTWSRGLRADLLAGEAEKTDEEAASEDEGGTTMLELPARTWDQAKWWAEHLLAAARADDDGTAVLRFLEVAAVEWWWKETPPRPAE